MSTHVKISHIAIVRKTNANALTQVCAALGWSEEKYCCHQYQEYENFCKLITRNCPELRNKLRYSPVFRGFFNNEWAARNAKHFLPFALREHELGALWVLDEYLFVHNSERLLFSENPFYIRFEHILKSI